MSRRRPRLGCRPLVLTWRVDPRFERAIPWLPSASSLEDFLGPEMLAATEQMLGRYEAHQGRIKSLAEQLGVQPSQKPPELKDQLKPPQEQ